MKKFLLVFGLFLFSLPAMAVRLEGGVTYTVESARKEAFDGVKYKIPVSTFSQFLTDPDFDKHQEAMGKGKTELKDRLIENFQHDGYCIIYKKDRYKTYCYDEQGKFSEIQIFTSLNCPMKTSSYDIHGNLTGTALYVTWENIYVYSVDGKLESHWVGDIEYDLNGKITNRRLKK